MDKLLAASEAQAAKKLHAALPANPRAAIRPMEAVLALLACWLLMAWLDGGNLAAQIVEERHQQIVGCISQYGPGERWARTNTPKCAPMVEAPAYILTMPVSQ